MPKIKPIRIEDRYLIAVFDVRDEADDPSGAPVVCDRYGLTTANTVVRIDWRKPASIQREWQFLSATAALAFCIEQTGWGTVVEHLPSWEALNDPQKYIEIALAPP